VDGHSTSDETVKLKGRIAPGIRACKGIVRALALGLPGEGERLLVDCYSDATGAEAATDEIRALDRRAVTFRADLGPTRGLRALTPPETSRQPAHQPQPDAEILRSLWTGNSVGKMPTTR